MAAIVMLRPRDLKKAADTIPRDRIEHKWNNSLPERRRELLTVMSSLKFSAVYTSIDKNNPVDNHPIYGNDLYERTLREVISDAMDSLQCRDVNVLLDGSGFVTLQRFREIVFEEAKRHGKNPKTVHKISSEQNRCIQLADFIAGASRAYYEYGDDTIELIRENISVARRH